MGRLASILTLFIPPYEGIEEKEQNLNSQKKSILKNFFSFFLECQRKWGWYPLSCAVKKIQGQALPLQPLIIELITALVFVLMFSALGWSFLLLEYLLFAFALIIASAVDIKHFILPDSLTLSGIVIGLLGAVLNPEAGREFLPALLGVLTGGGFLWLSAIIYYAIRKEDGLGGGDIKLLAWMGAVLTWKAIPFVILTACFAGVVVALFGLFRSSSWWKKNIPFGPYLAFAGFVYIFYGKSLAEEYFYFFSPLLRSSL